MAKVPDPPYGVSSPPNTTGDEQDPLITDIDHKYPLDEYVVADPTSDDSIADPTITPPGGEGTFESWTCETPVTPNVTIHMGQEDNLRDITEGVQATSDLAGVIVFSTDVPISHYEIIYEDGPEDIGVAKTSAYLETAFTIPISGDLTIGTYEYRVKVWLADLTSTSLIGRFTIGCNESGGGGIVFDPSDISRWIVWSEFDNPVAESYDEDEFPTEFINSSTRVDGGIVQIGDGFGPDIYIDGFGYRRYGINGLPAVYAPEGDAREGHSPTKHVEELLNKDSDIMHFMTVFNLPVDQPDGEYITILRTGNIYSLGGYSDWRLYNDRIDVWHTSYGFYPTTTFGYSITIEFIRGLPFLFHLRGDDVDGDDVTIRSNGEIIGGVSNAEWSKTAGSTETGEFAIQIMPIAIGNEGCFYSGYYLGREPAAGSLEATFTANLSDEFVGATTDYLLEKYHLFGTYEPQS